MNDKDKTTEKNQFTIIDDNGKEIVYDVLFTFDSDETKKSYVVYTDNTKDELGNIKVYANTFDPFSNEGDLGEIETEKEWATIEQIFASINEKKEG